MKCPHCLVEVNPNFDQIVIASDVEGAWGVSYMICPNTLCRKLIIKLELGTNKTVNSGGIMRSWLENITKSIFIRPLAASRPPAPPEVDKHFATDYNEACLILALSPNASAALSRRCLQSILREKGGVKKGDLAGEIQQVIDSGKLPSLLSESIDAIRAIGNFAAHPMKSTSTGEIVDVEPGEAEWVLDVLEALFDFYFVQPAILKAKKDALNKKLSDMGKPGLR